MVVVGLLNGCNSAHDRQLPDGTKYFGERTLKDGTKTSLRVEFPDGHKAFDVTHLPDGTEKSGRVEFPGGQKSFDVTHLPDGTEKSGRVEYTNGNKYFNVTFLPDGSRKFERVEDPNGNKIFDMTLLPNGTQKYGRVEKPNGEKLFDVTIFPDGTQKIGRTEESEEAARKTREELGDQIEAQISYYPQGSEPDVPSFYSQYIGYQFHNLRMFVNRKTGTLTIIFDCEFMRENSVPPLQMLVRLFDSNGQHITHFVTKEYYATPAQLGSPWFGRGNRQLDPIGQLKRNNYLHYRINLRDAAYVQRAEFGVYCVN
jgi:hypothetical protein